LSGEKATPYVSKGAWCGEMFVSIGEESLKRRTGHFQRDKRGGSLGKKTDFRSQRIGIFQLKTPRWEGMFVKNGAGGKGTGRYRLKRSMGLEASVRILKNLKTNRTLQNEETRAKNENKTCSLVKRTKKEKKC